MKNLLAGDAADIGPKFTPCARYVNVYLDREGQQMVGTDQPSLAQCQSNRYKGEPGITIKIARDANGDIFVIKVDEF